MFYTVGKKQEMEITSLPLKNIMQHLYTFFFPCYWSEISHIAHYLRGKHKNLCLGKCAKENLGILSLMGKRTGWILVND